MDFFYEKKDFFQLKDLEKALPKEKGITPMSVKEVVTSLVDDGMVDSEKIGTSIYFWSFPSKASQNKMKTVKPFKLKLAYEAVKEGIFSMRGASKHFGVPRSTLRDRFSGRCPMDMVRQLKTSLTKEEEKKFSEWGVEMERKGIDWTRRTFLNNIQIYLNKLKEPHLRFRNKNRPSKQWFYDYLKRHPQLNVTKEVGKKIKAPVVKTEESWSGHNSSSSYDFSHLPVHFSLSPVSSPGPELHSLSMSENDSPSSKSSSISEHQFSSSSDSVSPLPKNPSSSFATSHLSVPQSSSVPSSSQSTPMSSSSSTGVSTLQRLGVLESYMTEEARLKYAAHFELEQNLKADVLYNAWKECKLLLGAYPTQLFANVSSSLPAIAPSPYNCLPSTSSCLSQDVDSLVFKSPPVHKPKKPVVRKILQNVVYTSDELDEYFDWLKKKKEERKRRREENEKRIQPVKETINLAEEKRKRVEE